MVNEKPLCWSLDVVAFVSAIRTQTGEWFSGRVREMLETFFHLISRVNNGLHMRLTIAGFALIHIAAVLLFTAAAPYVGLLLAFVGFALYGIGVRRPFLKPQKSASPGSKFFKA